MAVAAYAVGVAFVRWPDLNEFEGVFNFVDVTPVDEHLELVTRTQIDCNKQ